MNHQTRPHLSALLGSCAPSWSVEIMKTRSVKKSADATATEISISLYIISPDGLDALSELEPNVKYIMANLPTKQRKHHLAQTIHLNSPVFYQFHRAHFTVPDSFVLITTYTFTTPDTVRATSAYHSYYWGVVLCIPP